MKYEYAYELVAAVFVVSVAVSYASKNWLSLRANHVFRFLVNVSVVFTVLDVIARVMSISEGSRDIHLRYILSQISCLEMVGTFTLFFIYFLALTGRLKSFWNRSFLLAMVPSVVLVILVFMTPWNHFLFYYDADVVYHRGWGHFLVMVVTYGYAAGMCILAFANPAFIKKRDAFLCLVMSIAHMGMVVVQYTVLRNRFLLAFYFSDFMVVVFYLLFQNMDRFLDRISGGFSRSGFQRVIQEKYRYRERFGCLFVTIQNYQNITSVCNEQEKYEIMGKIGSILRWYGGRRNQYHIHGSDFVVLKKREEELVELYKKVSGKLPGVLRVNNRNISIIYNYFVLTLEETGYEESEFYKMASSMKRQLKDQTDSRKLMRYEGEVQREVNQELYIGHKLKEILQTRRCDIRFFPIMDAGTKAFHALEAFIYLEKENGRVVPEEVIWSVARDLGYTKELGRIAMESTMECVSREKVLRKGFNKIAINITPLHVSSSANVRSYKELAEKYSFPLNRFCMELTEDMSVSYEVMREHLDEMNKEGVSLILDRYGENVCNMQGILRMPFSTVKVCSQMVQRYCRGESDILEYQIQMLRDNGWNICLEGIDNEEQYQKVKDLGVSYYQGKYFSHPLTVEQLHYMEEDYDVSDSL